MKEKIKRCPKCSCKLYKTEDDNWFCMNCGVLESDELLEALLR